MVEPSIKSNIRNKMYEEYDNAKIFLSAHGGVKYGAKNVKLGKRRIVTLSGYGELNYTIVSEKIADMKDYEIKELLLNPPKKKKFENELNEIMRKYNINSDVKLIINTDYMKDMELDFMRDSIVNEKGHIKVNIRWGGLTDFENRSTYLGSGSLRSYDINSNEMQIKNLQIHHLADIGLASIFINYVNYWIPNIPSNSALKKFLLQRAQIMRKMPEKSHMLFKDIFSCNLSELIEADIIPDESLIFLTSCRGLDPISFPDGGIRTEDPEDLGNPYHKASAIDKEKGKKDEDLRTNIKRFFNSTELSKVCNLKPCKGPTTELPGRYSTPNMFCKEQGCLDCTEEDTIVSDYGSIQTCKSCEEGRAILINCNDNITMCFTKEEILEMIAQNGNQIEDTPTMFDYCDIPAITVAALYSVTEPKIELGVKYIREKFIEVLTEPYDYSLGEPYNNNLQDFYKEYMFNVVLSFKYLGMDNLKDSFESTIKDIIANYKSYLPEYHWNDKSIFNIILKFMELNKIICGDDDDESDGPNINMLDIDYNPNSLAQILDSSYFINNMFNFDSLEIQKIQS